MQYLSIYSMLFLMLLIGSCDAQNQPNAPKSTELFLAIDSTEHDPYFNGTNTVTSPYGPTTITRNILQDRKGNIWLATWDGIIRFAGQTFTNFTNKEGLRRFRVFSLLEDSQGHIWFGTIGAGVYRYDGQTFTNITEKEGLANDKLICMYEDDKGRIWFGTADGISVYDGIAFRNFTTADGLPDGGLTSIIQDKNGTFWIGTRGTAHTFDGQTFTKLTSKNGRPFVNIRSMIKDQQDNIWLGGNDGLWRYDGQAFTQLSTHFVGYIYEDSKGNIWTSSEGEFSGNWVLSKYDKKSLSLELPTATPILQKEDMFFGILEDTDGAVWLGTLNGVGRYDGTSFDFFRAEKAE